MITITIQEKRQYFQNFTCEVLTSKEENKAVKDFFESKKNENSLGTYFKDHAWNDDLEGETRIYLVKDLEDKTALFFSLKCGLLFKKKCI